MYTKSILIAALTATVSADLGVIHPGLLAAKRDIEARASSTSFDTGATACLDALLSIYSGAPTPPPEVISWETASPITDPCQTLVIPGSISAAFSSYESAAVSWYSAHSSEIFSALSQCPQYSAVATAGAGGGAAPPLCTNGAGGGGAGGATVTNTQNAGTITTGTSTATTTGNAAGGSSTKNASPRETSFVGAAIAAAGFLGVVAAL